MKIITFITTATVIAFLATVAPAQKRDKFHHSGSPGPKVNYQGLFSAATPLDQSQAGKQLLDDCLAAYGGTERLADLKGFELTYETSSRFTAEPYKLVKAYQRGRHYRITRLGEERILNGNECWVSNEDTLMSMDQGRYRAELYSYLSLAMPMAAQEERFDDVRYGERPDDPLGYVYLSKSDSMMIILGIDKKTHMILTTEGVIPQRDQNYVFISRFDRYENHEGFLFPGAVTNISMGLEVGTSRLARVRVNPGFNDQDFRP